MVLDENKSSELGGVFFLIKKVRLGVAFMMPVINMKIDGLLRLYKSQLILDQWYLRMIIKNRLLFPLFYRPIHFNFIFLGRIGLKISTSLEIPNLIGSLIFSRLHIDGGMKAISNPTGNFREHLA